MTKHKNQAPAATETVLHVDTTPAPMTVDQQLEAMLGETGTAPDPMVLVTPPEEPIKLVAPVVPKLKRLPTAELLHPVVPALVQASKIEMSDAPIEISEPKVYVSQRTLDEMEAGRKSIERH